MRYLAILLLLGVTLKVNAQQINPVPDYIFRNQMSVGRNAATDTAAYMSIGPRYGAVKGFMPPMVVDTNAVTGTKRNGLLIFSVQLNNFAYWDSTTSRFRQITAQAVVDSLVFATRAWRKKGDDSLGAVIATRTDTALLSTKAYRQKAVDSLVTLISTLGGGTVLSVSAGTGMNFTTITTSGSVSADTSVLSTRAWRKKGDDSLGAVIAGKVNISDTATMLGAYLRKADTTAMLTPYLRKADTTSMLSPYVRTAGFGLTKGTQTLSADTAALATRARVQKGIDSVASLVAAPDSLLFSTRAWRQKGVDSVAILANSKATATGTTNYLSKFTGTSSLGNSIVYATTSEVGISTPSPTHPLDVNGRVRVRTIDSTATGMNMLYADVDGVIKKAAVPAGGTVTSVATGFGLSGGTITTTGTLVADTNSMATRARVQKAVDSLQVNINAKGSGTVTSVGTGFGLVPISIVTTGTLVVDSATVATRARVQKGIDSVANLSRVTGSGISGYIPKWTGASSQDTSQILQSNGNIGIGMTPVNKLDVSGAIGINTSGQTRTISTYFGANSVGQNIWIGNGGNNSLGAVGQTFLGSNNTSLGHNAMNLNTTGFDNVAIGRNSMQVNTTGFSNTSVGTGAMNAITTGFANTAIGVTAMASLTTANSNNAFGSSALRNVTTGNNNTAVGATALQYVTTGGNLVAIGNEAGRITGVDTIRTNTNSLYIGFQARPSANGNTNENVIGHAAIGNGSNTTTIGNTSIVNTYIPAGELIVGGTADAGAYALQVAGSIYNTTGAVLAATSGNVGIGVTPNYKLHIGSTSSDVEMFVGQSSTRGLFTQWRYNATAGNAYGEISTYGGDNRLEIQTQLGGGNTILNRLSGNVGIGNITPSEKLHVGGKVRIATIDSSASPINMLWADVNGVIRKAPAATGTVTSVGAGFGMSFNTISATGNVAVDSAVMATRARVQKGIDSVASLAGGTNFYTTNGTLTGTRTITTGGNNLILSGASGDFEVSNTAGTQKVAVTRDAIVATGTSLTLFAPSAQPLILSSGNGEAARFTSNKDLGIGTTSPSERLHINGGNIRSDGKIYIKSNLDENTAFENSALTMGYNSTDSVGWIQAKAISYSGAKLVLNAEGGSVFVNTNASYGSYSLQVNGIGYFDGGIRTGTGTGVTPATWKLGSRVATTGLTLSTTEYLEVNIGGQSYQIALVN